MCNTTLCTVLLAVNDVRHTVCFPRQHHQVKTRLDVESVTRSAKQLNGLVEIRFQLRTLRRKRSLEGYYVVAVLPCGARHYVGPLVTDASVSSARLMRCVPAFLQLELHQDTQIEDWIEPPWPCEMLLKEHVKALLDTDGYCGSLACSHVQNIMREFPFYDAGLRRFTDWVHFVRHFNETYRAWHLVVYHQEQHQLLQLSELMMPGELRMVSNKFRRNFVRGDVVRDRVKWRALANLRHEANALGCDLTCHDPHVKIPMRLLEPFSLSPSFQALHSANVIHYISLLPWCLEAFLSPQHPVQVERRSNEAPHATSVITL